MMKYDFTIIGGDKRTACMALVLAEKGYRIACFHTLPLSNEKKITIYYAASLKEALESTRYIIAGIPLAAGDDLYCEAKETPIPLSELHRCLRKKQKLFAGVIPANFRRICEEREIGCYDFMSEEPLTLQNAVATAEGAILEALLHKSTVLHQSECLVLGYGRCGKVLADKLKGLGACVCVCSNQEKELALANALGFRTMHLSCLAGKIRCYEYIFNTIPACVLKQSCLANTAKDALIIDIASNKTGADYEAAKLLKLSLHHCPGLPGKYAQLSSARNLADYVLRNCSLVK